MTDHTQPSSSTRPWGSCCWAHTRQLHSDLHVLATQPQRCSAEGKSPACCALLFGVPGQEGVWGVFVPGALREHVLFLARAQSSSCMSTWPGWREPRGPESLRVPERGSPFHVGPSWCRTLRLLPVWHPYIPPVHLSLLKLEPLLCYKSHAPACRDQGRADCRVSLAWALSRILGRACVVAG